MVGIQAAGWVPAGTATARLGVLVTPATLIYGTIAFAANRLMAFVEKRTRVPGFIAGGK